MHSWSSWLLTLSPGISSEASHYFHAQYNNRLKKILENKCQHLTLFVLFFVFLFAFFTRRFALRGLRRSSLSSATWAASWGWRRGGGAGQHFAATQGAREELKENWRNTLIHQEADLEQEVQHSWTAWGMNREKMLMPALNALTCWQRLKTTYSRPSCRISASWLSSE